MNGDSANANGHSLRVPFREISLSPSKAMDGTLEENLPVRVYDTSGPWTDTENRHNVNDGLPAHRIEWIRARGDVEEYDGREVRPQDNGYLTKGAELVAAEQIKLTESNNGLAFINNRRPLRSKSGACVTQMHYARKGIITPEMEYIAIRENLGRERNADALVLIS
jgi:phosphomethylpyrimidine synthase